MIETFIVMFAIGVVGVSLFWIFGDGKLRQQQLASILIYLWMFMIVGLLIGFIDWIIVWYLKAQSINEENRTNDSVDFLFIFYLGKPVLVSRGISERYRFLTALILGLILETIVFSYTGTLGYKLHWP